MIVSWNWLAKYLKHPATADEVADRLSLSGLNHEGTFPIDGDLAIDLEVTSNRGDCLGHLGVAREIGVLYDIPVDHPDPSPEETGPSVSSLLSVENSISEACSRYTARVIRNVKVGPSPDWLVEALSSIFWKRKIDGTIEPFQSVNNVVDATNFVMMECGQPLHAFDYDKIGGQRIQVRAAAQGEKIQAIDHKEYSLDPSMCVIADGSRPVAVAGVMGGADCEVTEATTNLVIEAAIFTPLSVRRTARALKLHSPSSYRFERRVDPVGVEWASRRVCELILEIAGGELCEGILDTEPEVPKRDPISLSLGDIERLLGIHIDAETTHRILTALGCLGEASTSGKFEFTPPSWRHDLTRAADLIEEVARIHGYDKIPEDAAVPVVSSAKRRFDVATDKIRNVLTAGGLSEAMTPSVVTTEVDETVSPWSDRPALQTQTPMLKGSKRLRRTLISSLIEGRGYNWTAASLEANLFEIAHVYLPGETDDDLPAEVYTVGMICGGDYFGLKGLVETLCQRLGVAGSLEAKPVETPGMIRGTVTSLSIGGDLLGYLGTIDPQTLSKWKMPAPVHAAELSLPVLLEHAHLVPQQQAVSQYPSISRDLNLVMDESIRWSRLEQTVRNAVNTELAGMQYLETYRDPKRDGADRKRVLFNVELQRHDQTLSSEQAESIIGSIISACEKQLDAKLFGG
ncbi:MAG: phenylalanine--tRNA ligase subunit beta [Planctomycetota bacterium]